MSFYKPAKKGHIASSAEAKSTADLEIKVTPSESRVTTMKRQKKLPTILSKLVILIYNYSVA